MLGEDGRSTLAGLRWRGKGTPQRRLPDVQPAFRDLDHERFLHGPATLSGRGGDGRRRHEVPGFLPSRPAAGHTRHRDDGHTLPGLLLERLRVRGDLLRPKQPDSPYRRRPAQHPDGPELGSALGDRYDRRATYGHRRTGGETLPGKGPHARRGNRRVRAALERNPPCKTKRRSCTTRTTSGWRTCPSPNLGRMRSWSRSRPSASAARTSTITKRDA